MLLATLLSPGTEKSKIGNQLCRERRGTGLSSYPLWSEVLPQLGFFSYRIIFLVALGMLSIKQSCHLETLCLDSSNHSYAFFSVFSSYGNSLGQILECLNLFFEFLKIFTRVYISLPLFYVLEDFLSTIVQFTNLFCGRCSMLLCLFIKLYILMSIFFIFETFN